jgi:hypothetical protein
LYETIQRLIHPEQLTHLWALAAAGLIGFVGNEIAARVRLRALAAAPQVGDHLDLHGESIVVHHVTRSARAGLAGVIVAGRP